MEITTAIISIVITLSVSTILAIAGTWFINH